MTQLKRHSVVDPKTGRVDLRYNPLSIEEDYYIPIRGGQSSTDIVNLPGASYNGGTMMSSILEINCLLL